MSLGTKTIDDLTFNTLVGNKVHFVGVDNG